MISVDINPIRLLLSVIGMAILFLVFPFWQAVALVVALALTEVNITL